MLVAAAVSRRRSNYTTGRLNSDELVASVLAEARKCPISHRFAAFQRLPRARVASL